VYRNDAHQHEAHVRNSGIGQHPFDIGLGNSDHIPHNQRQRDKNRQHVLPVVMETDQSVIQQPYRSAR